jgi:hypothetical protein
MVLCEAHRNKLLLHYAIDPGRPEVRVLEEGGQLRTVTSQEIESLSGWRVDGPGLYIGYPGNGAFVIRPDNPPANGPKYIHPKEEPNHLFVPPGFDLIQAQEIWITEGELKALCGFLQGLPIVALGGVWSWRTSGPEAELLANGEKLSDSESLLPELAQINWSGKKVTLLYDSDITPGHRAYDAFPRLAEQFFRQGASEVKILTLPPLSGVKGKVGLDDLILAKGPELAFQYLQAMKSRTASYLPTRDGGLAYAERLIKSEDLEDKKRAAIAILGAKGKFIAGAWLKEKGLLQKDITPLLQEAKEKLAQIQAKPRISSSSQVGEDLQLGPEYAQVKALLQPYLDEFSLDEFGRIGKVEWVKGIDKDGKEVYQSILKHICNFAPWPIRQIFKDSGTGAPERYLELQGLLQGGVPLGAAKISLLDFSDKNSWAGQLWGFEVGIKPNREKDLKYAINLMAKGIPTSTIYSHLGWREINGSWIYLHAGGAIGPGSENVEVEISERLRQYSLPGETDDIKEALKASLALLELGPKKLMYPSLALVYLAPLCEPLRQAGIEPSLLSYIWGVSGSKKSTLIALLLSHFGNFEHTGLPASFRDTANSIEKLASLAKDTVLAVDDFYPSREPKERAKQEGVLEHLSRN